MAREGGLRNGPGWSFFEFADGRGRSYPPEVESKILIDGARDLLAGDFDAAAVREYLGRVGSARR